MKKLIILLTLLNLSATYAAYPNTSPALSPSITQQRLQNQMATQQQLHQQQLHQEQQRSAQQLQQENQLHQQKMLRKVQENQP